jgi:hypothetical protein
VSDHHAVVLDGGGYGQEHVAARHDGGIHEQVNGEVEVETLESAPPPLGLCANGGAHRVGGNEASHMHLVGLIRLQALQEFVGLHRPEDLTHAGVLIHADTLVIPGLRSHDAVLESQLQRGVGSIINLFVSGDGTAVAYHVALVIAHA